jgi:hypothetical protein
VSTNEQHPFVLVSANSLDIAAVEWLPLTDLGEGWVALKNLFLLDGYPFVNKSTLMCKVAVDVVRTGGVVVLLSDEDDPHSVIVPRLMAAGATKDELARIGLLKSNPDRRDGYEIIRFPQDTQAVEQCFAELKQQHNTDWGMIAVDPVVAYLGTHDSVDGYRDQDIRSVLLPLSRLVQRQNAFGWLVRHFNKSENPKLLLRGGGSIGFQGLVRRSAALIEHPDDVANDIPQSEQRRTLIGVGTNIGVEVPSVEFRVQSKFVGKDPKSGKDVNAPELYDFAESGVTPDNFLARASDTPTKTDIAEAALQGILTYGPRPADEVKQRLTAMNIAERTIQRAAGPRNGLIHKKRFGSPKAGNQTWYWALSQAELDALSDPTETDGNVKSGPDPYCTDDGNLKAKQHESDGISTGFDIAIGSETSTDSDRELLTLPSTSEAGSGPPVAEYLPENFSPDPKRFFPRDIANAHPDIQRDFERAARWREGDGRAPKPEPKRMNWGETFREAMGVEDGHK